MKKPEVDEKVKNTAENKEKSSHVSLKKVKYGSMSLIVTALVVAIVIILNAMASYMVKHQPLKIDLTADKRYELSDETIDYLKNTLDKDVEIIVTCNKDEFSALSQNIEDYFKQYNINLDCPFDMIPIILEKYEMYSTKGKGSVKVRYVDLDKDPKAVKKYSDIYGAEITSQSMVVYCDDRVRVIDKSSVGSMIAPDTSNQASISLVFAGESMITSEIMNVTDAHPINVAFASKLNGSEIYDVSHYADSQLYGNAVSGLRDQLLVKNGYFCTDIDLAKDEIDPEKYDMLVIPMPSVDFDESIIDKISKFLDNDGKYDKNLLFITDPMTTNTPHIKEFLEAWSISPNEGQILVDDKSFMSNSQVDIQIVQSENEDAGEKISNSKYIVAPFSQELNILKKNNDIITSSLLETHDTAFNLDIITSDKMDSADVKTIAAVSRKEKQIGDQIDSYKIAKSHVMVLGSGYLTSPVYLMQSNLYNNASVLVNALNTMTGKQTETIIIPDKALQQAVIAPTSTQDKRIKVIVIFIIPLIVAGIGIFVLIWRKNR